MRKTRKNNRNLLLLIDHLYVASHEHQAPIWRDIAKRLERSRSNWAEVNVAKLARFAKENDILVVPGKLLGSGEISVPVTVASFKMSRAAEEKIHKVGGKTLSLAELVKENPKGTNVRIMG